MRFPRPRFTVLALMGVVMLAALVINRLRPITRTEAERVAVARFLAIPGASRWVGRYRVHAWPAGSRNRGDVWMVDFTESGDGAHLSQITVDSRGRVIAVGIDRKKFR